MGAKVWGIAVALAMMALLSSSCGGGKSVIRLHVWEGSPSHYVNNAIAEFIIEKGYEIPVEEVVATTQVLLETLPKGEVDLNIEGWQHNIIDWYDEQIEKGNIVNLGMTYEGGPQFFVIPRWMAEEHNIRTVSDMADNWSLFQDPQDPTKGVFYNCPIGTQCIDINTVKLEAYGLARYYNSVQPASLTSLAAILSRAQERRQPVFGYHWEPTAVMGAHDWYVLEEPSYTDECWGGVMAATLDRSLRPIDRACAYESPPIEKLAHKGLLRKAPDVVEMLRKMVVGKDLLSITLAWGEQNEVEDPEQLAIHYLQTYEDRWRAWVTPDAYELVNQALQGISVAE